MDGSEYRVIFAWGGHDEKLIVLFDGGNANIGFLVTCPPQRRAGAGRGEIGGGRSLLIVDAHCPAADTARQRPADHAATQAGGSAARGAFRRSAASTGKNGIQVIGKLHRLDVFYIVNVKLRTVLTDTHV